MDQNGQLQGWIKKQRCLSRRKGEGERDNGIIYFDVDAIFFFVGGSFIGSGGYLGCVAFAGRHFDRLECVRGQMGRRE